MNPWPESEVPWDPRDLNMADKGCVRLFKLLDKFQISSKACSGLFSMQGKPPFGVRSEEVVETCLAILGNCKKFWVIEQ